MWDSARNMKHRNAGLVYTFVLITVNTISRRARTECEKRTSDDVVAEAAWSAAGAVGDGANAILLDVLHARQVEKRWASSSYAAGVGVFVLASDSDWLARLTNWPVGQTSDEEADWTWVFYLVLSSTPRLIAVASSTHLCRLSVQDNRLSYRRGTARRSKLVKILLTAA